MSTIKLDDLQKIVEDKLIDIKKIASHSEKETDQESEADKLERWKEDFLTASTKGSEQAREFTKNQILTILTEMKDQVNLDTINDLIKQYHVNYFKNIYTNDDEALISDDSVGKEIALYFQKYSISEEYSNFNEKLNKLVQIIYQEMYGFSIVDELIFDSDLNEVGCNRRDYIWVQFKGIKRQIPNIHFKFKTEELYQKFTENKAVAAALSEMNAGNPRIHANLDNGTRVTALRPDLSSHYAVTSRLFKQRNSGNIEKFHPDKMTRFIEYMIKGRRNFAIVGEMGSGKTTYADSMIISKLDDNLSIGVIENVHELNLQEKYPHKNIIELQYGEHLQPSDVTELCFRLNRDILIFGEVRGGLEAFEAVKAMTRQSRGSLFTFHSTDPRRCIQDFRQLLQQTGLYQDGRIALYDTADAIDIIVLIRVDRRTGKRYVVSISESIVNEKDMTYDVVDLFVFDKNVNKYLINPKGVDPKTLKSCLQYELSAKEAKDLKELFKLSKEDKNDFQYMEDETNQVEGD